MLKIRSIKKMQLLLEVARQEKKRIGFVPTMGSLHEGHQSLLRKSKKDNDLSILSIFVNPKQFFANEDFALYPRDEKKDEILAKKEKVDIILYPSIKEMYPDGYKTYVDVEQLSNVLCGESRSGHFRGVATVVAKLLNIVCPDKLYLGQKDAQQAVIIKQMVNDLNFPSKIEVMPTVRENDGLAMSSRNSYLSMKHREEVPVLFKSLKLAKYKILKGETSAGQIIRQIRSNITQNTSGRIDYIECVNAETLQPLRTLTGRVLIAVAVWFGRARLIDNIILRIR